MKYEFYNTAPNKNGYGFSLFPLLIIEKLNYMNYQKFNIVVGIWFWTIEFIIKKNIN